MSSMLAWRSAGGILPTDSIAPPMRWDLKICCRLEALAGATVRVSAFSGGCLKLALTVRNGPEAKQAATNVTCATSHEGVAVACFL